MVSIADAINMAIKQGENRQKILKIQESFVNNGGNNVNKLMVIVGNGLVHRGT
jgi:hypothetical protein